MNELKIDPEDIGGAPKHAGLRLGRSANREEAPYHGCRLAELAAFPAVGRRDLPQEAPVVNTAVVPSEDALVSHLLARRPHLLISAINSLHFGI